MLAIGWYATSSAASSVLVSDLSGALSPPVSCFDLRGGFFWPITVAIVLLLVMWQLQGIIRPRVAPGLFFIRVGFSCLTRRGGAWPLASVSRSSRGPLASESRR